MNISRSRSTSTSLSFPNRLSFLWPAAAGSQLIFSNGMHITSITTWPGLVFLVSFLHTQKTIPRLVLDYLVNAVDYQGYFLSAANHHTASRRRGLAICRWRVSALFMLPYVISFPGYGCWVS